MTTTYTVLNENTGDVIERGLSAVDAMDRILTDDGYAYEIRPMEGGGFRLWHSNGSRNSYGGMRGLESTRAFSLESDERAATQEIAECVISAGWPRLPEAMTDADYDARLAEIEADQ